MNVNKNIRQLTENISELAKSQVEGNIGNISTTYQRLRRNFLILNATYKQLRTSAREARSEIERRLEIQTTPIDAEIAALQTLVDNENAAASEREKAQQELFDLVARRRDFVIQSERAITEVTRSETQKRLEVAKLANEVYKAYSVDRIRNAVRDTQSVLTQLIPTFEGITQSVREGASAIRSGFTESITDINNYQKALERVQEIANIGVQFDTPQLNLQQLREQANLDQLLTGSLTERATIEQLANVYREYVQAIRAAEFDAYGDLESRILEGSQRTAETAAQGFERAWQDARERDGRNAQAWLRFQTENAKRLINELQKDLRERVRLWQEYTSDVVPLIRRVIDEQIDGTRSLVESIKAALREFITASLARIAQDLIEKQILIAQERRYQRELIKTAVLKSQAFDTQALLTAAARSAGLGAAGLLAPGGGVPFNILNTILLQIGDGQIREIANNIDKLASQGRR